MDLGTRTALLRARASLRVSQFQRGWCEKGWGGACFSQGPPELPAHGKPFLHAPLLRRLSPSLLSQGPSWGYHLTLPPCQHGQGCPSQQYLVPVSLQLAAIEESFLPRLILMAQEVAPGP